MRIVPFCLLPSQLPYTENFRGVSRNVVSRLEPGLESLASLTTTAAS